jgi:cyanophycinase-like exopeptidase
VSTPGLVTLIGSGEVSAGMVKVHRQLLEELGPSTPRPVFLATPAGFELGAEAIAARFVEYFRTSLGLDLRLARYHSREDPPAEQADALEALAQADYIIAGPGSPTYAVEHLRGTPILATVLQRWQAGAQLVFASAATIALGRHALPVYEIYKVGRPLSWAAGLDIFGDSGIELAIIPHWDNAEGGTHDTRACFMGMDRFSRLRTLLPESAVVLGVDEHTAVSLDLAAGQATIRGKAGVSVLRATETLRFNSGDVFPLDLLRPVHGASGRRAAVPEASPLPGDSVGAAAALIGAGDLPGGLRLAAEGAPPTVAVLLLQAASHAQEAQPDDAALDPFLRILIELRASLRERGEWALADGLRDRLMAIGFDLRDTPEGTVWVRRPAPPESRT